MRPEPHRVAASLGFDETTICRLAARGHLCRLALTEPQIRVRLYRAYDAYLLTRAEEERTSLAPRQAKRTSTQIGGATCDESSTL
jgi:hypothetical protein